MTLKGTLEVVGMEDIETDVGTFTCYKANIRSNSLGETKKEIEETAWISADEHRYIVKYKEENMIMKLVEISKTTIPDNKTINNNESNISLVLPESYSHYKYQNIQQYLSLYQLFSHKTEVWSLFVSSHIPGGFSSKQKIIDAELKILKGFFKKYKPRTDSWNKTRINGLPVIQYTADYKNKKTSMVEYRSYHFTKSKIHCFVFRIPKNKFEKNKIEFDKVIEGLQLLSKNN